MRVNIKCPWSRSGSFCPERRCPLDNKRYNDALDLWALTGRTPRALNPEPSPGGGYDPEMMMLRKCRINNLFNDSQMVLDWILDGKSRMTTAVCKELIEGERRYSDMVDEERCGTLTGMTIKRFAETDDEFKKWCSNAKIEPTRRQASKWLRKFGLAWKMKQEVRHA